jgi:hypothetical protein
MAKDITPPKSTQEFPAIVVKQMTALATASFGVAAALAWNEVIRSAIDGYIRPLLGPNTGVAYFFIYAMIVTVLAVVVTWYLSRLEAKIDALNQKLSAPPKKS